MEDTNTFLFSVDLEDVRSLLPNPEQYKPRVPELTHKILDLLGRFDAKITFFVVGELALRYPELIQEIAQQGHEIACHSQSHKTLNFHNEASFRSDLLANIEALKNAGAHGITGFRAPCFSLTETQQTWAYRVLSEVGFKYSSSVLPARSPLFGWESFGTKIKRVQQIIEMPMSVCSFGPLTVPFAGGVYFRVLPFILVKQSFKRAAIRGQTVLGYLHPYDIDTEQEHFMHPGINNSKVFNQLMYLNRHKALPRLKRLLETGYKTMPYCKFAERWEHPSTP